MKYWEAEDKWVFNLEGKNEYLYSEDDDKCFTSDGWFYFSLDQSEVRYIVETNDIV